MKIHKSILQRSASLSEKQTSLPKIGKHGIFGKLLSSVPFFLIFIAIVPSRGFAYDTLFYDNFEYRDAGTTSTDTWSTYGTPTGYLKVVVVGESYFEASDTGVEVVYITTMTITDSTGIFIRLDIAESGAMAAGDYIKGTYKIDGGAEKEFYSNFDDLAGGTTFVEISTNVAGTGNELVLRVKCYNTTSTKLWRFDNVKTTATYSGSKVTLFSENFENLDAGTTSANGWSTYGTPTGYFYVQHTSDRNKYMEASDTDVEVVWITTTTITNYTGIFIRLDIAESGTMAAGDYIKGTYKIDGGAEKEFYSNFDDLGTGATFIEISTNVAGTGNEMVLRVKCYNTTNTKFWRFDNIKTTATVTANTAPNAPELGPTPKTGQFNSDDSQITVGGEASSTTVKLSAMISDPDSNNVMLELEIRAIGVTFSSVATHTSGYKTSGTTVTIAVGSLTEGTTYHWQCRTADVNLSSSAWVRFNGSDGNHFFVFTTTANTAPTAPSALSPADGSWTGDNTPTLSFTTADANGDDVKFYLQISSYSDFSSNAVYYVSTLTAAGASSFTVGQAEGTGQYITGAVSQTLGEDDGYYWRVWLEDENGAFSSTTTANGGAIAFGIDKTTPTNVGCSTPANNAVDVSNTISLTALTALDSVSGGLQYYFEIDEVTTFDSGSLANSGWLGGASWSPALSDTTTYYWRVQAKDAAGNTSVKCGHTADNAGYGKFVTEIVISTANLLSSATGQWHYGFEGIVLTDDLIWEELGTASGIDCETNASYVKNGIRALRLEDLPSSYGTRNILSSTCTVTAGQNYTVEAWVFLTTFTATADTGSAGDVKIRLAIRWYDSGGGYLSQNTSADLTVSAFDTWEKISYINVIAPAGAVGGRMLIDAYESNALNYDPRFDDASFHVMGNMAPNAPTLTSPADNASTNDTSPAFTWSFSDPNTGNTQSAYQWQLDSENTFAPVISSDSSKITSSVASYTPSAALAEGVWFWRVKTWDADDAEGSYAAYRTLKIDITAPGAVTDLAATAAGSNIEITWTAAGDNDIDHQVLYRATRTITITNKDDAYVTKLSNSLAPTAGSYTDPAVNFGTTYYYVVTAWDEATNESGISNCPPGVTPSSASNARLAGTDYYCEPLFTPGNNTFDGTWKPYMNQRLIALINSAQSKCYVAIYNLTDDDPAGNSITDSLIALHGDSKDVKVITDQKNNASTAINALKAAGITVVDDGTDYPESHNKFAVIDGKYVWTGSANWTSGGGFDRQDNDVIIIQDETVAGAYEKQFLDMFNPPHLFHTASTTYDPKNVSGNKVEFYFTGSEAIKDESSFGLRYKVQNAAESCIGAIYTFVKLSTESLEEDLEAARSGGKVVRLVLDRDQIATSSPYSDLDGLGMNVRPDNNPNIMHSKLMVIDQEIVATGSMNWTQVAGGASSNPNDENYLFIHDEILARQYIRYLMRLHELASDEDITENPTADTTAPSPVSNVYAYGSGAGQITVEFDASADPNFSRYYIFISTLQNYASAMAVKQKFIDTNQYHLSDACDNDGDKAVDEEIFNGINDDGDGLIDEDINMMPEKVMKPSGSTQTLTVQIELQTYSHGRPLDNNTTYWVCVLQTDKSGNESEASYADASEPTAGDSFYGPVFPGASVTNTPPECAVVSPSGWKGRSFGISAEAWDNDKDEVPQDYVLAVEFQYSTASASGPWFYVGTKYEPPATGSSLAPSTGTYIFTWPSASYITLDSTVWIRAYAKDNNGHKYSLPSVSTGSFGVDNKAPSAPSPDDGIVASGSNWTQDNNPIMSWTAVADPGAGLDATEPYLVRYDTGSAAAQSGLTYTKTLSDGSHIFYVAAKDAVGNISAYGNHSVNVDNTPPPATVVTDPPVVEFDRITVEWNSVTDATSGVLHYNVYRDVADIVSVGALTPIAQPTTTSYTDDEGLTAGVTYFYVVCAVDKAVNEASISNCVSEFAGAPPVKASVWHIPSSTTVVAGSHTYRDPSYDVHKGTKVYFYSKSATATQSGLTLYWGTDGTNFASSVAGQHDGFAGGYDFWYATVTITQSGGTTFYYYLAADYSSVADRTYLYDLYSNGISSTSAFAADAVSKPFKLYIINTPPPAPSLTSPNGGEELFADDVWTITWSTVTDPDGDTLYYDIDYSVDGGVSWNGITGNAQGSSYAWTVENTPYEGALMRIRAYDGTDYSDFDESDSTFTITAVTTDHIVISEVCIGYGVAATEYVELYNPTTSTVTLYSASFSLGYTTGTLLARPGYAIKPLSFINNTIQPKGFFLIGTATDGSGSIGGVALDATWAAAFLRGTDGVKITRNFLSGGLMNSVSHDWSFEGATGALWSYTATGATWGDTTQARDGNKSLKYISQTTVENGRLAGSSLISGITAGESYSASMWMMCTSGIYNDVHIKLGIEWYDASDTLLSESTQITANKLALTSADTWQQQKYENVTAPASAAKAKIKCYLWRSDVTDRIVYIDGASLSAGAIAEAASLDSDKVGFGTASGAGMTYCTETTKVSELKDIDSNWSMERKAYPNSTAVSMVPGGADNNKGNAVDTDNNSADFVVHQDTNSFTPQNSLSAVEPPPNTSAPTLSGGTVSPAKGTTATSFTFSVNYTDLGNDRPTSAKVYIDGDGGHPMGSSDEVYDNGSVHTYATTLSAGAHEYYFYFSDGKYYVRYPATGVMTGPNVGPNLDTIEIIRPSSPADNANIFPGSVTFECCLSGGGAGDVNGYSSFEAQLKYSLNGGAYQTLAMTQDSAGADGNYFTVSKNFVAGDYVNFYFEGRDSDSTVWDDYGGGTSYFTVGMLPCWHYSSTIFRSTAAFPATYRYPLIPLQTQTVDIFAGCESSTASVSIYYAVNALPVMVADGSAASGSVKIDIEKEFSVAAADDDREGNYFTTRVSTNPIPIQNDGDIVYYFIKANLTGYPTTYLITDGNALEGSHMTPKAPSLKTQCFSYTVGEVELIDAFHIASLPHNPSDALWMREVVDDLNKYGCYPHTSHGARTETINVYFGKNADSTDYAGGAADLTATLYFRQCSPNPESDWHVSTFTYCLTNGSTDYWHCEFVQPSGDSLRFTRDDIVEYYIELKKSGAESTVLYPGKDNQSFPDNDNNSDTIALSIFEKNAQYNNSTQPKFWYKIKNFPPVMQYALYPADYAQNIPLPSNQCEFRWDSALDYDGDLIVQYNLEVSKDITFATIITSSVYITAELEPHFNFGGISEGAVYYWRVRALDEYGNAQSPKEWGDWCNNKSHWTFFSLGAARIDWVSMSYGPTGTENSMANLGDAQRPTRYTDITNYDAVQIQFWITPSPAAAASEARVYYAISASQADPVVTYADSTNTVTNSFFFRTNDVVNTPQNTYGEFGTISAHVSGDTSTVIITIPADVHRNTDTNYYFWVQPCATALAESATSWINGEARCYAITENADKIVLGRDTKDSEFPTNYSITLGTGDSNSDAWVDKYTPLWHNPSSALMPGYTTKNYVTPQNDIKRVVWDINTLDVGAAGNYVTSAGVDGNMDIYYGEDPGIYMRTAYHDLGSGGLAASGCSVVMSYNNFAAVKTAPLSYEGVNISTSMSPYDLKYSFLKALESSDVKNMPENAEIRYYFKLSQGTSSESFLCKNGAGAKVVDSEGTAQTNPFTYHVLQDDYTRPFVWKEPKPYAVPGDGETLCGRSVGYVMISLGLADTVDGCITPVPGGAKLGPFNTWPGGWADAVTEGYDEYLLGDAANHSLDIYNQTLTEFYGNNVPAVNVSTITTTSGVVSSGNDNIDYTASKRWAHQTLCYFAYMSSTTECTEAGFRTSTTTKQLFAIANVDGEGYNKNVPGGKDWNPGSTKSGVVEMAPTDAAGTEWYARIPVPPNVEEVPYLYYRIWACNGDADPQARNTERGGGGQVGSGNAGYLNGGGFGLVIVDPYLEQYPMAGEDGAYLLGGKYRDRDYGWVTRSLFAGMVAKPAQVRITAIVNYRNTRRQVTAFMKIDGATRRPSGILSIQVNTPKMIGD